MGDERDALLLVDYTERTTWTAETKECRTERGWQVFAKVGDAFIKPPMSERLFETRDEALREGIAWVRLRAVHTHPDGSMRDEVK